KRQSSRCGRNHVRHEQLSPREKAPDPEGTRGLAFTRTTETGGRAGTARAPGPLRPDQLYRLLIRPQSVSRVGVPQEETHAPIPRDWVGPQMIETLFQPVG